MDFAKKTYVYLDAAALCDEHCERFMEEMAGTYRQMILFVANVWEKEALKHMPGYAYICRVVYETDIQTMLQKDRAQRKNERMTHVLVITKAKQQVEGVCVLHLTSSYGLDAILQDKRAWEKKTRCRLGILASCCVAYLICYFHYAEQLPIWMQEGWIAFLCFLLPFETLVLCIAYGISKRVISMELLLELLDF